MIKLEPPPIANAQASLPGWLGILHRLITSKIQNPLDIDVTTLGCDASAADTTLSTYTLPIKTIFADDQSLAIESFGSFAANGNDKRVRLNLGSTTLFDSGTLTTNDANWKLALKLYRTSATGQTYESIFAYGTSLVAGGGTATEDFEAENDIDVVGNGDDASDVVHEGTIIKWQPNT